LKKYPKIIILKNHQWHPNRQDEIGGKSAARLWLGVEDSNLGIRIQSPLSYR
jgi:hypothetical protein